MWRHQFLLFAGNIFTAILADALSENTQPACEVGHPCKKCYLIFYPQDKYDQTFQFSLVGALVRCPTLSCASTYDMNDFEVPCNTSCNNPHVASFGTKCDAATCESGYTAHDNFTACYKAPRTTAYVYSDRDFQYDSVRSPYISLISECGRVLFTEKFHDRSEHARMGSLRLMTAQPARRVRLRMRSCSRS